MKTSKFFSTALAYTICLIAFFSCQETDSVRNALLDESVKVTPRQDCSNCDCSCFVELKSGSAASLELCGTCEGPVAGCMGDATCGTSFNGNGHTISLTSTLNPRYNFCEDLDSGGFWIKNTSSTDIANIVVSCTATSGTPQTITLTLNPMTMVYIGTDGDCEVFQC